MTTITAITYDSLGQITGQRSGLEENVFADLPEERRVVLTGEEGDLDEYYVSVSSKTLVYRGSAPSPEYEFDYGTKEWVRDLAKLQASAAQALRDERDSLLAASDWTQLPDVELNVEQVQAWTDYRQALRDLPAAYPEITSLDQVEFPVAPL